ncbi:MAG: tRNA 2-thiouridine(34) synthase MnmA [Candidatus Omnitrophica bacterium]|nr:tRNA 2-thiouridine(34) synthase MnmA [Candidatus Omnitrophota bacterium]
MSSSHHLKTVAVGMSGGVDSALTAYLLKKKGHEVVGLTMKIWDNSVAISNTSKSGCYGPGEDKDIIAAQETAKKIGIRYHVIDLHQEYKQSVVRYYHDEYLAGRTPNPCIVCNQKMKFGLLLEKAYQSGIYFDAFATGHYASTGFDTTANRYFLKRSLDPHKDQTYFLYRLEQSQLQKVIFPLGDYHKTEIKKLAAEIGFKELADKPESQDFFEGDDNAVFFKPDQIKPGDVVDTSGRVVARHKGIIYYTIGQRKGLDIGGLKEPLYVVGIDACKNRVIVGPKIELLANRLVAGDVHWIFGDALKSSIKAQAKIRLHHPQASCEITPLDSQKVEVIFEEPQMSITPGQSVVFYDGDIVLGGGIIE